MFYSVKNVAVAVVGDSEICVAEFEQTGSEPNLVSSNSMAMPSGIVLNGRVLDRIKFIEILSGALGGAEPAPIVTKEIILVVPEQQVYLVLLNFPESRSISEIFDEAPKEALASIPLDSSQLFCDFFAVPPINGKKDNDVVYAACDKGVIAAYLQILIDLKLKPVMFAIEPDVIVASEDIDPAQSVLFLVLNRLRSYWVISTGNAIKKTAKSDLDISTGDVNDFDGLKNEALGLIGGLNDDFGKNKKDSENKNVRIVICTECSRAKQMLGTLLCLASNLQKSLNVNTKLMKLRFEDRVCLVQLAYGAARRFFQKKKVGRGIDLLPARFKEQAALFQLNSFISSISIMFIIAASAFISVYSYAWSEMYFDYGRAESQGKSISRNIVAPRFQEIKSKTVAFNGEVYALTQIQSGLYYYSKIWKDLSKVLGGRGITSNSIRFISKDLSFELAGIADTRADLQGLEAKLKELPFVSDVISPLSNLDRTRNITYSLSIKLDKKNIPYISL